MAAAKEKLTLDNIKKDLMAVLKEQTSNTADRRLTYIIPITFIAIFLGVLLKSVFLGLLIFAFPAYQAYLFVIETRAYKEKKKTLLAAIEKGDISVSTEILSHIAEETIYEPHTSRRGHTHLTKQISVYYFEGGSSWRVPSLHTHYAWSRENYISAQGLLNTSVKGNAFFVIRLQGHYNIAYIYPFKTFEPDESIKK